MLSTVEIMELEKKLFTYRIKRKLYYGIFLFIAFFILGIGVYLFYNQPIKEITKIEEPILKIDNNISTIKTEQKIVEYNLSKEDISLKNASGQTEDIKLETVVPQQNKVNDTIFLSIPVIKTNSTDKKIHNTQQTTNQEDFDKKQQTRSIADEEIENKLLMKKTIAKPEETFYRNLEDEIQSTLLAPPIPKDEEKAKSKITIESKDVNSIQYLKDKFEKTHNIIFALMLSEEYYLTKNFSESNKWSLIANSIDSENEKSWIWFAKSKVKLGHKEDAIIALQAYLKKNKSKAAESLLNQINLGDINE